MHQNNDQGCARAVKMTTREQRKSEKRSLSMHEGVEVWEDCCSCEAEPYWLDAFANSRAEKTKG